jgi:hypothetical protein
MIPLAGSIETLHNPGSAAVPAAFVRARRRRSQEPNGRACFREQYNYPAPLDLPLGPKDRTWAESLARAFYSGANP